MHTDSNRTDGRLDAKAREVWLLMEERSPRDGGDGKGRAGENPLLPTLVGQGKGERSGSKRAERYGLVIRSVDWSSEARAACLVRCATSTHDERRGPAEAQAGCSD